MTSALLQLVVRSAESQTPDAELLTRFTQNRDEAAFKELVRRHGSLVWSVCRQLLPHHVDAEDSFQAVFLALMRSASRIRQGQALAGWLHGVAVRVCTKVKRSAIRRKQREERVAVPEASRPVPDTAWATLMATVHEEIQQLPDLERTAFVLCELEGVRQLDAAVQLGWPLGTLSGRLCKARQKLLEQLTRRGIAPVVLTLGGLATTTGHVPAAVLTRVLAFPTAKAAGVSSTVATLARGLSEGVTMQTKVLGAALVMAASLGITGGAMVLSNAGAQAPDVIKEVKELAGGSGDAAQIQSQSQTQGSGGLQSQSSSGGGATQVQTASGPDGWTGMWMGPVNQPQTWDYRYAMKPKTVPEFVHLVTTFGKQGWELAAITDYQDVTAKSIGKPNLVGNDVPDATAVVVFKRPQGGQAIMGGRMGGGMTAPGLPGMPSGGGEMAPLGQGNSGRIAGREGGRVGPPADTLGTLSVGEQEWRMLQQHTGDSGNTLDLSKIRPEVRATAKATAERAGVRPLPESGTITKAQYLEFHSRYRKAVSGMGGSGMTVPDPSTAGGGRGVRGGGGAAAGGGDYGSGGGAAAGGGGYGSSGGFGPPSAATTPVKPSKITTVVALQHAKASEIAPVLQQVFESTGDVAITVDPRTNQLIIIADEKSFNTLEAILQRLDVPLPKK